MTPDKIEKNIVVTLQYKLTMDNGELVEESEADDPLMYLHGHENIVPGLERELEGLKIGDSKDVIVEPADAYGDYDDEGTFLAKLEDFPEELTLEIGAIIPMDDEEGNVFPTHIAEITDEGVLLDFNHPLAGERLRFQVTITALREPTSEELDHGHVHQDGHHH